MKKVLAALVLVLVACGKRGDPRPPVPVIPKATNDLVVAQRGSKVILTWSYPSLTTSGATLRDLRRVVVYRVAEEIPAAQPLKTSQFLKLRERVDSIEGANLPASTAGARLVYEDSPPIRPHTRLSYAVISEGADANSDVSNFASIEPVPTPQPPSSVVAKPAPDGVVLTWTSPATSFNVYRRGAKDPVDVLATPINPAPLTAPTYIDKPPYGNYQYSVSVVASTSPRIESEQSPAVAATFKDLTAPPAPATLTTLVEPKGVRLLWDAVDVPDIAGYFVYRYEGKARIKFQTGAPIPSTHFEDISPDPGIEYVYAVTALDKNGNESPERKSDPVLVPKTP